MIFLENPAKRRRKRAKKAGGAKRKRKPPRGFRTWKAYMASIRPGAKKATTRRRKRASTTTTKRRRRRRTTTTGGTTMARKRRRTTTKRKASPRRRRRHYRRNPPPFLRGVMKHAGDGAAVVAGKAAARVLGSKLTMLPKTGPLGLIAQLGVAAGVSYLSRYAPASSRQFVQAGAFAAVIEDAVVGMNIPVLSSALDSYPLAAYPSMNALPYGGRVLDTDEPAYAY